MISKNPPSDHAMAKLDEAIRGGPYPAQEINFTVRDKLTGLGFARLESRPSPYKSHKKGQRVEFLVPTSAGACAVRKWKGQKEQPPGHGTAAPRTVELSYSRDEALQEIAR